MAQIAAILEIPVDDIVPPDVVDQCFESTQHRIKEIPISQLLSAQPVKRLVVLETPESILANKERDEGLFGLLHTLPYRQRVIISKYFGVAGEAETSQQQIAREAGLTPSRVAQIVKRSLWNLERRARNAERVREFTGALNASIAMTGERP